MARLRNESARRRPTITWENYVPHDPEVVARKPLGLTASSHDASSDTAIAIAVPGRA
jgi:hypothetical protein